MFLPLTIACFTIVPSMDALLDRPLVAVTTGSRVYTLHQTPLHGRADHKELGVNGFVMLSDIRLDGEPQRSVRATPFVASWKESRPTPLRWHIDNDLLRVAEFFPHNLERPGCGGKTSHIPIKSLTRPNPPDLPAPRPSPESHLWPYDHYLVHGNRTRELPGQDIAPHHAHFDFTIAPGGQQHIHIVVLGRYYRWSIQRAGGRWEQDMEREAGFRCPFRVVLRRGRHYIVTATGAVYCDASPQPDDHALHAVWTGRPVRVMIQDLDRGAWYAFTESEFFELTDVIRPRLHSLPSLPYVTADDMMNTCRACAALVVSPPTAVRTGK